MELSPTRGAYFEKITSFVSDSILNEIWSQNESKRGAKMSSKINQKINVFSLKKVVIFDPPLNPKGGQNESNGRQKTIKKGT